MIFYLSFTFFPSLPSFSFHIFSFILLPPLFFHLPQIPAFLSVIRPDFPATVCLSINYGSSSETRLSERDPARSALSLAARAPMAAPPLSLLACAPSRPPLYSSSARPPCPPPCLHARPFPPRLPARPPALTLAFVSLFLLSSRCLVSSLGALGFMAGRLVIVI